MAATVLASWIPKQIQKSTVLLLNSAQLASHRTRSKQWQRGSLDNSDGQLGVLDWTHRGLQAWENGFTDGDRRKTVLSVLYLPICPSGKVSGSLFV